MRREPTPPAAYYYTYYDTQYSRFTIIISRKISYTVAVNDTYYNIINPRVLTNKQHTRYCDTYFFTATSANRVRTSVGHAGTRASMGHARCYYPLRRYRIFKRIVVRVFLKSEETQDSSTYFARGIRPTSRVTGTNSRTIAHRNRSSLEIKKHDISVFVHYVRNVKRIISSNDTLFGDFPSGVKNRRHSTRVKRSTSRYECIRFLSNHIFTL